MLKNLLTKEQIADFKEYGYVVIKGFYNRKLEIEPIQYGIWKILNILFEKYRIEVEFKQFSPENFDYGYQKLISVNRKYGGEVYDAIKQIPIFMRLISLEKNDQIFMGVYESFIATCLKNLDDVQCFIDQNPLLHNTKVMGKDVYHPDELPQDVTSIYLGVNPRIASQVIKDIVSWNGRNLSILYL